MITNNLGCLLYIQKERKEMNKAVVTGIAVAGILCAMSTWADEVAVSKAADTIIGLKAGPVELTVFDSTGANPVANATVVLTDQADPTKVITLTTDDKGLCKFDLPAGKYTMTVNGTKMGIVDTSVPNAVSLCKVIMPGDKAAAAVAGAGILTTKSVIIGGAVIVTGVIVYDQTQKDKDKKPVSN